jgi:hypothetical protein
MEGAGWFDLEGCCSTDVATAEHCAVDDCESLESGFVFSGAGALVKAAALLACTCFICRASLNQVQAIVAKTEAYRRHLASSISWLPEWSFEHRLALPARAPSLV